MNFRNMHESSNSGGNMPYMEEPPSYISLYPELANAGYSRPNLQVTQFNNLLHRLRPPPWIFMDSLVFGSDSCSKLFPVWSPMTPSSPIELNFFKPVANSPSAAVDPEEIEMRPSCCSPINVDSVFINLGAENTDKTVKKEENRKKRNNTLWSFVNKLVL